MTDTPNRVLICGDRNWTDRERIANTIRILLTPGDIIIEGEARGADSIAREEGEAQGFQVLRFPALWQVHGKSAGPIRNQQMLVEGRPTIVFAFHDDISNSKGTKDMVERAKRAGIPTRVFTTYE